MRRPLTLLLALAMCLTLSGCFEADVPDTTPDFWEVDLTEPPVSLKEPEKVTEFTLPYFNTQTLDPVACPDGVQQVVGSLLYEGLFVLDGIFEPHALLCSSYNRSSNGLTYTFHMREEASFSDGSALTANDVLATYRRAQVSDRYGARFANVASMRVNRGTLVITLMQPDSALPALLDIPIVKAGTEKSAVPLGTGPFWFSDSESGTYLKKRENWWRQITLPLTRIALTPAKDADAAVYLFSAEAVHLITADLLSDTPASALGADAVDAPTSVLLYLGINAKRPALSHSELRAAMSAAVDRSGVASTLLAGHALGAQFPISPVSALYPSQLETPDAAAYGEAVDQALELRLIVNEENSFKSSLAEHLARQLSAGSLTVTATALPWADYVAALESGDFDLYLGEVRLTADWDLRPLVGTDGALNYGKYKNAELDKALDAFLKDENADTAAELCEKLAAEAPLIPIAFKSLTVLTSRGTVTDAAPTAAQPFASFEDWGIRIE